MATKPEVNRIREGAAGQIIATVNGVSTWVDASTLPAITNMESTKPIFKVVHVATFVNMIGKTQHLIIPTGVNLYSLKVYKDGLLYAETDDYGVASGANGLSVLNMEAYEGTEVLQFEIIVTDAASRAAVLAFFADIAYTGQYPN